MPGGHQVQLQPHAAARGESQRTHARRALPAPRGSQHKRARLLRQVRRNKRGGGGGGPNETVGLSGQELDKTEQGGMVNGQME